MGVIKAYIFLCSIDYFLVFSTMEAPYETLTFNGPIQMLYQGKPLKVDTICGCCMNPYVSDEWPLTICKKCKDHGKQFCTDCKKFEVMCALPQCGFCALKRADQRNREMSHLLDRHLENDKIIADMVQRQLYAPVRDAYLEEFDKIFETLNAEQKTKLVDHVEQNARSDRIKKQRERLSFAIKGRDMELGPLNMDNCSDPSGQIPVRYCENLHCWNFIFYYLPPEVKTCLFCTVDKE